MPEFNTPQTRINKLTHAIRSTGWNRTELEAASAVLMKKSAEQRQAEAAEVARLEEIEFKAGMRLLAASVIAACVLLAVAATKL